MVFVKGTAKPSGTEKFIVTAGFNRSLINEVLPNISLLVSGKNVVFNNCHIEKLPSSEYDILALIDLEELVQLKSI